MLAVKSSMVDRSVCESAVKECNADETEEK